MNSFSIVFLSFRKLSVQQKALLLAYAESETKLEGTVNGITVTKEGKWLSFPCYIRCTTQLLGICAHMTASASTVLLNSLKFQTMSAKWLTSLIPIELSPAFSLVGVESKHETPTSGQVISDENESFLNKIKKKIFG